MPRRPAALRLEALEDRLAPAVTFSYTSTGLTITGTPTGALTVTGTSGNNFKVQDGTKSPLTYNLGAGSLTIALSSRPSDIEINLHGQTIGGNVSIDLGNGLTGYTPANQLAHGISVDVFDDTATNMALGLGTIRGNLSIQHGNGSELLNVGVHETDPTAGGGVTDNPLTVRGTTSVTGKASGSLTDYLLVGEGTDLRGAVTVNDIDDVSIGEQNIAATPSPLRTHVRSNITVNTGMLPGVPAVSTGLFANFMGLFDGSITVNGNASTSGANSVTVEPTLPSTPDGDTVVLGSVSVTLAYAAAGNRFTLQSGYPSNPAQLIINGTVSLTSTAGPTSAQTDTASVDAQINGRDATTGRSLTVDLGAGNNSTTISGNAYVAGDAYITGLDGDNYVEVDASPASNSMTGPVPTIRGNLTINFGGGDNIGYIYEAVGGLLTWTSQNGDNFLFLNDGAVSRDYSVAITFGTGDDTLMLNGSGTISGSVNWGDNVAGNDYFDPGSYNTTNLTPTGVI